MRWPWQKKPEPRPADVSDMLDAVSHMTPEEYRAAYAKGQRIAAQAVEKMLVGSKAYMDPEGDDELMARVMLDCMAVYLASIDIYVTVSTLSGQTQKASLKVDPDRTLN